MRHCATRTGGRRKKLRADAWEAFLWRLVRETGLTLDEIDERFADHELDLLYASQRLDDEREARLTARVCARVNEAVMNALRLSGRNVADEAYRTEDDYLPASHRPKRTTKAQSYAEMRRNLGFG